MDFRSYLGQAREEGVFIEHGAGDVETFRYPHMADLETLFTYDDALQCWKLDRKGRDSRELAGRLRAIAAEDITVYEFLCPSARLIHCLDMIGITYPDELRERAFAEVRELYEHRQERFPSVELSTVCADELEVADGFSYLGELYREVAGEAILIAKLDARAGCWPFGSVLKGTDIVLTDGTALNFGQDVVHALYHLHEGIPGVNGDNCQVREVWAPVPALYALQLAEGRMSRRMRLAPSPHPIHFTDYIFLRAYLGQAFAPSGSSAVAHPALAAIQPALRLMASALDGKGAWDRNRILADAILADRTDELAGCFEARYGAGSFAAVFDTYELYGKRERALAFVGEAELDRIMFEGPDLIQTNVGQDVVERIWKDEALRDDWRTVLGLLGMGVEAGSCR